MTFIQRLMRFGVGLLAGIFLVMLFFGRRNSCKNYVSNYLPEGRVLSEMQFKPLQFTEQAQNKLNSIHLDTATFRKEILPHLDIDFDESDQRARPCGIYIAHYQDSTFNFQVRIEKCKDVVNVTSVK